ncbi:U3 small nucleolar RNA-associated protein 6 [Nematocida sp. AWRm77]|nr:U3 small nucleolar RNA-associated protein 6 [Nematocida sp. AWRm77]
MNQNVQREMEGMLKELHYYTQRELFTPSEIESVVQKRRGFEELVHTKRSLHAMLKYIEYEVQLEKIYKKRAQKLCQPEEYIKKRITGLFRKAESFFPSEDSLLLSHLDYLVYAKDNEQAYHTALDIPRKRPDNPEVWAHSAEVLRKLGEVEASRSLLQRGLRLAGSKKIIPAFIRMEETYPEEGSSQLVEILQREMEKF